MTNTNHTPTPWRVVRRSNQTGVRAAWLTNDRVSFEPIRGATDLTGYACEMDQIAATLNAYNASTINAHDALTARVAELEAALRALADLAHSTTRPSQQPALCRALVDIEGIARAALEEQA